MCENREKRPEDLVGVKNDIIGSRFGEQDGTLPPRISIFAILLHYSEP